MEYWLASARVDEISEARRFPLSGITTNPSLIAQAGPSWRTTLESLDRLGFGPVQVQTVATALPGVIEEVKGFRDVLENVAFIAKLPVCEGTLQAIPVLKGMGLAVNVTAVCTINQGVLAMAYGADFVSVYVARMTELGGNGMALVENLRRVIDRDGYRARVMASSIRNVQQLGSVTLAGAHAVAVPFSLLRQAVADDLSERSIRSFAENWKKSEL